MRKPKMIKQDKGLYFLWFTWLNNKDYCFIWDFDTSNIWWKPKIEKQSHYMRIGWLCLSVGFGKHK